MKEHVVVFDKPPKFGKEIPLFYEIQIFDVNERNKGGIITLLQRMGFSSIKEVRQYENLHEKLNTINTEINRCLSARYNVNGVKSGYDDFWKKKELIEVTLDCLTADRAH